MSQGQKTMTKETRSIARQLARELRPEELDVIAGGLRAAGTTSCSCCRPDDCDA
jgi:hypothetical protein